MEGKVLFPTIAIGERNELKGQQQQVRIHSQWARGGKGWKVSKRNLVSYGEWGARVLSRQRKRSLIG
jgi:hypothetical protein